jgi:hypothetical protein
MVLHDGSHLGGSFAKHGDAGERHPYPKPVVTSKSKRERYARSAEQQSQAAQGFKASTRKSLRRAGWRIHELNLIAGAARYKSGLITALPTT